MGFGHLPATPGAVGATTMSPFDDHIGMGMGMGMGMGLGMGGMGMGMGMGAMGTGMGMGMGMGVFRIGRYTLEERQLRIIKYRQKRHERNFTKKMKAGCRQIDDA
ncbi:unnamed protein product [Closterium sp. NIES-54]